MSSRPCSPLPPSPPRLLALAVPAPAQKIPADLRSAFEGKVRKGFFGVVVQKGIPTTSIYGKNGDETAAYYSVDVKGGEWQTSEGLMDFNQVAVDALTLGEVMEVVDVTYKDARIDLRMASLEAHKVTRRRRLLAEHQARAGLHELQVLLPLRRARRAGPAAGPGVHRALAARLPLRGGRARLLGPARGERRTRAGGRGGSRRPAGGSGAHAGGGPGRCVRRRATTKKEIKPGMSMLEVIDVLGRPQKEVSFETKTRWTYPDLVVIFVNGRVKEVQF